MMVMAVLDTHMLKTAVTSMNPPMMERGRSPTNVSAAKATRLCRPQRCIARASMNPPMNR
jgi:hypothetical protein